MERFPMNELGEPNMGNPSVRFDEGPKSVGHWPLCLSTHPLPPTLRHGEEDQVLSYLCFLLLDSGLVAPSGGTCVRVGTLAFPDKCFTISLQRFRNSKLRQRKIVSCYEIRVRCFSGLSSIAVGAIRRLPACAVVTAENSRRRSFLRCRRCEQGWACRSGCC